MKTNKKILDVCCGGRMFWFDKNNPNVLFLDNRTLAKEKLCNGQTFGIAPDVIMDFRHLKLDDATFSLVVFDPPHLRTNGKSGWMAKKYGRLDKNNWKDDLRTGFSECFRVLKTDGVLIFKWNEYEIPLKDVLALTPVLPLFGHTSGALRAKTHWVAFMKK